MRFEDNFEGSTYEELCMEISDHYETGDIIRDLAKAVLDLREQLQRQLF